MTKKDKPSATTAGKAPRPSFKSLASNFLFDLAAQALVDAPNDPGRPKIGQLSEAEHFLLGDGSQKMVTFISFISAANELFLANSCQATQNSVRQEIKKIFSLANIPIEKPADIKRKNRKVDRKYSRLCNFLRNEVGAETLNLLTQRLASRAKIAAISASDELVDRRSLLPAAPSADREAYCNAVASLTLMERAYEILPQTDEDRRSDIVRRKPGRNRPSGKPSRPTPKLSFYAPPAEENPRWLSHVRVLEAQFAVVWHHLTDNPARDEKHYRTFVANLLEELLASSEDVDVAALVRIGRGGANLSGADSATGG